LAKLILEVIYQISLNMKKLIILSSILFLLILNLKAVEPSILIKTSQITGSQISFSLTALSDDTSVDIDWGNGILINFIVGSIGETNITGELNGEKIKIFGDGITDIRTEFMDFDSIDFSGAIDIKFIPQVALRFN
jgi:hypothetical protein